MWIVALLYCILTVTTSLSGPIQKEVEERELDDFYQKLSDSFDNIMQQKTARATQDWQKPDPLPDDLQQVSAAEDDVDEDEEEEEGKRKRSEEDDDEKQASERAAPAFPPQWDLLPLYPCDRYDVDSHSCVHVRQIGTTLTLGVRAPATPVAPRSTRVRWYRCYKRRGSTEADLRKEIAKESAPWNINIGGESNELRISPITEIDFSYNYFVATVENARGHRKARAARNIPFIRFSVEPINIDMGTLYPGEELVIYARAFMELPLKSVTIDWSLNDPDFRVRYDLPSNMKVNADGTSVVVKELRTSKDRILTCAVFSNKNIFLARRSFLFRKIDNTQQSSSHKSHVRKRSKRDAEEENEGVEYYDEDLQNEPKYVYSDKYDDFNTRYSRHDADDEPDPFNVQNADAFAMHPTKAPPLDSELFYVNWNDPPQDTFRRRHARQNAAPHIYRLPPAADEDVEKEERIAQPRLKYAPVGKDSPQPSETASLAEGRGKDPVRHLSGLIQEANSLVENPIISRNVPNRMNYMERTKYSFDDFESKLIASCKDSSECNIHATCHIDASDVNFCRCDSQYNGNGVFCWLI